MHVHQMELHVHHHHLLLPHSLLVLMDISRMQHTLVQLVQEQQLFYLHQEVLQLH